MTELKHYIDAFSHLHTAVVKGYKAPHKAVLLLAVIDMVEEGRIVCNHIRLSEELEERFGEIWSRYLGNSAVFTPDIAKPFFHMQYESFWWLVERREEETVMAAEGYEECRKGKKALPGGYSLKALRSAFEYAEIDRELFLLLRQKDARAMLRVVLINTYLTNQPTKTMPDLSLMLAALPLLTMVG